jgi:hypothetical protein
MMPKRMKFRSGETPGPVQLLRQPCLSRRRTDAGGNETLFAKTKAEERDLSLNVPLVRMRGKTCLQ